ncbi:hypothetical protein BRADI_1g44133v3, partial [Brachypodium distachyon]
VTHLRDRTFCFSVTNKFIGFHIAKLGSFTCSNFVAFFHLWGFGGPDYKKELAAWEEEELHKWQDSARNFKTNFFKLGKLTELPYGNNLVRKRGDPSPSSAPPPRPKPHSTVAAARSTVDGKATRMANFPVDPAPFLPGRFDIIDAPDRPQQCRYHVIGNIPAKNEDVAMPPPNPDAPFHETRDNIIAFLDGHLGIRTYYMQHTSLGHAIIRLASTSNRDWLVLNSPHQHNGTWYLFPEHNKGINWRAFTYNREVWIMILNLPLDLWETAHVNAAIAKWGKLISWDKTVSNLTRAIVKVRVESLSDIPYSIMVSHGNDFHAESWSCPLYILSQKLMGMEPPDEDAPTADEVEQNHLPEDPPLAQNLMHLFDEVQNQAAQDQGNQNDQDEDNAIALTLTSNAPDNPSAGSINHAPQMPHPAPQVDPMLDIDINIPLQVDEMEQQPNANLGGIQNEQAGHHNMIIGRVIIPPFVHNTHEFSDLMEDDIHQPLMEKLHITGEGTDIWQQYFKRNKKITQTVTIPGPWIDFFTAMLSTPENFNWAKKVLLSNMWSIFAASNDTARIFALPEKCPSKSAPICRLTARVEEICQGYSTPQAPKTSEPPVDLHKTTSVLRIKRTRRPPLVETEVRRSARLKEKNEGFKHNTCIYKRCLACAAKASEIKSKVVKSLSERFDLVTDIKTLPATDAKKKNKKSGPDDTPTKKQKKK